MPPWIYKEEIFTTIPENMIGFVYLITQISTGKKYIGKKHFYAKKTSLKTVTLKSGITKKKKIRSLIPSDWREYFGSSDALKAEIEKCGVEDFHREILSFCRCEAELTYTEAREQFVTDCLRKPDEYFNSWISCRIRGDHLNKSIK